jgi:hypothetical protein
MPHPAHLRRTNVDRAHDPTGFLIVITFGPGRWPRVPPWRPRSPGPPPSDDGLPRPLPDADLVRPTDLPAAMPSRELEDA